MGVSLYVEGYRKADEQWNKMKAIWNACHDAKISVPKEVDVFFDYHNPNKMTGKKVSLSVGRGKKMRKPGSSGAPTAKAFKDSAKKK